MPRSTKPETLSKALAARDFNGLRSILRSVPPGDSARLLSRLDRSEQRELLTLLPVDEAAQLLQELSITQAAQCLRLLVPDRAAALIEHFPSNEQADLLSELGDEARAIIASLSAPTAQRVRYLSHRGRADGRRVSRLPRSCRSLRRNRRFAGART